MKQLLIFDEKQYSYISIEKCVTRENVTLKCLKNLKEVDELNDRNKTLIYIVYDFESLYEAILRMKQSRNFIFATHSRLILKQFSTTQIVKFLDLNKQNEIKKLFALIALLLCIFI